MDTREELEAALAVAFDRHTLAVYADYLQSLSDPRGELIALDLEIEGRPCPPELAARRTSLLHAWLGALVPADNVHRSWVGDSLRFGFIEDLELDEDDPNAGARLDALLASDAACYVRGVTLRGRTTGIAPFLTTLCATRHTWLHRLTLHARGRAKPLADLSFDAMPNVALLELTGDGVLALAAAPARLRRLVLTGLRALEASEALPTITELDLAFAAPQPAYYYGEDEPDAADLDGLRELLARLPALRRLDLSRNERTAARIYDYGDYEPPEPPEPPLTAIGCLASVPQRGQLTHVRIPSVRSDDDASELDAAVQAMPALEELEIVHGHYFEIPDFDHPTAKLVRPPPWPWPRPTATAAHGSVSIAAPGARAGDDVALLDAIRILEQRFESLPAGARDAWTGFWHALADLVDEGTYSAHALVHALEACPIETGGWRQLNDELRARLPFPPGALVRITRD